MNTSSVERAEALPSVGPQSGAPLESPRRVQLQRTKGWRMPPNTVKVDRTTQWGNHDYIVGEDGDAEHCVDMFDHDLDKFETFHPEAYETWIAPLRGKNLACWCRPGSPCHVDPLLRRANPPAENGADIPSEESTGNPATDEPNTPTPDIEYLAESRVGMGDQL